ncbi:MAG: hypothetical protein N3E42_07230, partial [Candidatus Bipolaricaulota bacterium]|nr:hypothetical protein [Candidatus Bipolaricaulota bacterium]
MMMRAAKLIGLSAALGLLALAVGNSGLAQKTLTVCASGCSFTRIQDAINAAGEGDTIQVRAGTYTENLRITKALSVIGEAKERVVLVGTVAILATRLVSLS